MQCNEEVLRSIFLNVSSSSFLLLLILYSAVSLLLNLFHFIGGYSLLHRNEDEYDSAAWFSDQEEEEEEEEDEEDLTEECNTNYHVISRNEDPNHLVADIRDAGESLIFYNNFKNESIFKEQINESLYVQEEYDENQDQDSSTEVEFSSANDSPYLSDKGVEDCYDHHNRYDDDDDDYNDDDGEVSSRYDVVEEDLVRRDHSSRLQSEKAKEEEREERIGESTCTNESTSKSSWEWRNSSVKTDDPFSSSSRRSCPNWESYTLFQKYDQEMTFLTRFSTQKLHETESLKSIMVEPRSMSERIIHKISSNVTKKQHTKMKNNGTRSPNPYIELESAYIAQICLTWEALSWNYKSFERKRSSTQRSFDDIGCPAEIADQFRTFHILLQRYIENEPYEHGRRPEIYARMRTLAPKLLLVPEYQDYEDEDRGKLEDELGLKTRVSSASFLMIMEECIRTFMEFLKADKEKPCQKIIKAFFGRSKRISSLDPTLVHLMKKLNLKKKGKLKEMRKGGKYMKKKKMSIEEEMEILMGLIDLKVVSRVLRMNEINEDKLHWCEEKMTKLQILQTGKLQRDSTPLFFPPH